MLDNDVSKLNIIIQYCNYITEILDRINNSYDNFISDFEAQQAISFNILQIGENVNKLSDELKNKYNAMQWSRIVGMRNFVVHNYGAIDTYTVFNTALYDIPELENYCDSILNDIN